MGGGGDRGVSMSKVTRVFSTSLTKKRVGRPCSSRHCARRMGGLVGTLGIPRGNSLNRANVRIRESRGLKLGVVYELGGKSGTHSFARFSHRCHRSLLRLHLCSHECILHLRGCPDLQRRLRTLCHQNHSRLPETRSFPPAQKRPVFVRRSKYSPREHFAAGSTGITPSCRHLVSCPMVPSTCISYQVANTGLLPVYFDTTSIDKNCTE